MANLCCGMKTCSTRCVESYRDLVRCKQPPGPAHQCFVQKEAVVEQLVVLNAVACINPFWSR